MGIEVKNSEVIIRLVKEKLEKAKKVFAQAVEDEAARILIRTQQGLDVNGRPFVPYSEPYRRRKAKAGRNTSHPDLLFTGNMQAALQTDVRENPDGAEATIRFGSALEAAKARGNQQLRPFFGLSDEQVARIKTKVERGS